MGHRDMRLSGVFKRRAQGAELYMLDEGCLGWFERVASGVFPKATCDDLDTS